MTKQKPNHPSRFTPATRRYVLRVFYVVAALIVLWPIFNGTVAGWIGYGIASARCGNAPVAVEPGSTFAGGSGTSYYRIPGDAGYSMTISSWSVKFYCTQDEAVKNYVCPAPDSKIRLETGADNDNIDNYCRSGGVAGKPYF